MRVFRCISDNDYNDLGMIVIGDKCIVHDEPYINVIYIDKLCGKHQWGKHGPLPMSGTIWQWEEITFNKYIELCK